MATLRTLAACVALVFVVTGHGVPGTPLLLASTAERVPTLNLRLTATQPLPPASLAALVAETDAIWREGHIRLRWLTAGPAEAGASPARAGLYVEEAAADDLGFLRVLVMARVVPAAGQQVPWAVGELVRMEGARALAIASITGARRVVEEAGPFLLDDLPVVHDHRLGVVLGRALAHEIGHYLLQTNTHAAHGLMRATIAAREFADPRNRTFRLDKAAQAHLAELASPGTLSVEHARTIGTFSYDER